MALIECKGCGHKISDKAHECPKCGYINDNESTVYESEAECESPKGHKGLFIALACVLLVLIGSVATYFVVQHNREVARLEAENLAQQARLDSIAVAEQARIAEQHRRDSLYANFTSPDLNTFQVKGFVKRIVMEVDGKHGYYDQTLILDFDTAGCLLSATAKLRGNKFIRYKISRKNEYLKSLSYSKSSSEESSESGEFKFVYKKGVVDKMEIDFGDTAGADCDAIDANLGFLDFKENGLPYAIKYHHESIGGVGMFHEYENAVLKLNYLQFDQTGNWTEMTIKGTGETELRCMGVTESTDTESISKTLTRSITYYTPEEIFGKGETPQNEPSKDAVSNGTSTKNGSVTTTSGPTSESIIAEFDKISDIPYHYTGDIDGRKIEVYLKIYGKSASQVIGKYRYLRNNNEKGNWLGLKGTRGGLAGSNKLKEYNASGKCTGTWEFDERSMGGTFTLYDGKTYNLSL